MPPVHPSVNIYHTNMIPNDLGYNTIRCIIVMILKIISNFLGVNFLLDSHCIQFLFLYLLLFWELSL